LLHFFHAIYKEDKVVVVYVWVVGVTTVEKWLEIISEKFERDDREGVFFSANVFFLR